jgi:cytochrome c oxidase cbb3-type subunit 2
VGGLCAVLSITATYVFFLIHAEFALIELFRPLVGEGGLMPLMGSLGAGGIAGSLLAAAVFKKSRQRLLLGGAFLLCSLSALLASPLAAAGLAPLLGGLTGLGCGVLTVTLACVLGSVLPPGRLGLCVGAGTGLAYALCNMPVLFAASPSAQALAAAAACLLGAGLSLCLAPVVAVPSRGREHAPGIAWLWVLVFALLIWLDSAAFYVIQHSPALRSLTWEGGWVLWGNASTHLLGALLAGWLVDRGWRALSVWVAAAGLIIACVLLSAGDTGPAPRLLYTTGVSFYSTLLVVQAAGPGGPWQAGRLFALAGWVGSALGIGMAQDLSGVPAWFLAVAAVGIGAALALRTRRLARAVPLLVFGLAGLAELRAEDAALLITRGREVYIAEGCIHCHSQYVRPSEPLDIERWGPASTPPLPTELTPPLPGNRRQGPDLANVANRRIREWQRLHLIDPQGITPRSRMPSYAHLFEGEGEAGQALLEYLCSLGVDTLPARRAFVAAWKPKGGLPEGRSSEGRKLYLQVCSNCHGPGGRGDGPLSPRLVMKPADLARRPLLRLPDGPDGRPPALELARLIKFGVEGTLMAGHEYLSTQELADLAAHIQALPSAAAAGR